MKLIHKSFFLVFIFGININLFAQRAIEFKHGESQAFNSIMKWVSDSTLYSNFRKNAKQYGENSKLICENYGKNGFRAHYWCDIEDGYWSLDFLIYDNKVLTFELRLRNRDSLKLVSDFSNHLKYKNLLPHFTYYPPTFYFDMHKLYFRFVDSSLIENFHNSLKIEKIGYPNFERVDSIYRNDLVYFVDPINNPFYGVACIGYEDSIHIKKLNELFLSKNKEVLFTLLRSPLLYNVGTAIIVIREMLENREIEISPDEENFINQLLINENLYILNCGGCEEPELLRFGDSFDFTRIKD